MQKDKKDGSPNDCAIQMLFKAIHERLGQLEQGSFYKTADLSKENWRKSEIATIIFGVFRLGEKEFTDLMNQTLFMRHQIELE